MDRRPLTDDEQRELKELIAHSEALTAKRLALLVELSQLRQVSLDALMKQLQIKAPPVVWVYFKDNLNFYCAACQRIL